MEKQGHIVDLSNDIVHNKGVKGTTIISCLPSLDISTCLVPEFMHSVLLGVTKQFFNVWMNKKGEFRINKNIEQLDDFLLSIRPVYTFGRMPRSLKCFHLYKATELFNWLLYYSIPTLNGILPEIFLQHWILLVIPIYNLTRQRINKTQIDESENLLAQFVKEISRLYGSRELSYNVHQLTHLGLAVRRWGPLWATSAFPFEDQNGLIAKSIHGSRYLNTEIINNIKIAQGAKILRNKLEPIESNDEIFSILGRRKTFKLNAFQSNLLLFKGINEDVCSFYARAKIRNIVFTSTLYKTTKANSFTVKINFKDDVNYKYAIINCFIQFNDKFYLILQYLNLENNNKFVHDKTKSVVDHIIPFYVSNDFKIVDITEINSIKHIMQVGNYICKIINSYNTII